MLDQDIDATLAEHPRLTEFAGTVFRGKLELCRTRRSWYKEFAGNSKKMVSILDQALNDDHIMTMTAIKNFNDVILIWAVMCQSRKFLVETCFAGVLPLTVMSPRLSLAHRKLDGEYCPSQSLTE